MGLRHSKSVTEQLLDLPPDTAVSRLSVAGSISYIATEQAERDYLLVNDEFAKVDLRLGDVIVSPTRLETIFGDSKAAVVLAGVDEVEHQGSTSISRLHHTMIGVMLRGTEPVTLCSQQRKVAVVAMQDCYKEIYRARRELRDEHFFAEDTAFKCASNIAALLSPNVLNDIEVAQVALGIQRFDKHA